MTLLVGSNDTTGYTTGTTANGQSGVRFVHDSFVASASGTANTLFFYSRDNNGNNVKLCIYSNAGSLLGYTSGMVNGEGWISGALNTGVTIVSGNTYKLGWYTDSGYGDYYTDSGGSVSRDDTGTYTTPASSITSTGDAGIYRFKMYADGTTGGGSITADSGSFTETGVAANLVTTRYTIGGTGIFSLTGIAANLTKSGSPTNYTLTSELGLFSLNGQTNTLLYSVVNPFTWDRVTGNEGYRIKWGQTSGGPYTQTADNSTNDETYEIYAPYRTTWYAVVAALVGSVEQEYSTERVFTSGIPDLNGDATSYTLAGISAGLSKGYVVTATPASYVLSTINTGLIKTNTLPITVASFTYTGNDVNLNYTVAGSNYTLSASASSFSLTGVNTTLAVGYVLPGLVSTYTINGINTNLLYSGAPVTGGGRGNRCHIRVGLHL